MILFMDLLSYPLPFILLDLTNYNVYFQPGLVLIFFYILGLIISLVTIPKGEGVGEWELSQIICQKLTFKCELPNWNKAFGLFS